MPLRREFAGADIVDLLLGRAVRDMGGHGDQILHGQPLLCRSWAGQALRLSASAIAAPPGLIHVPVPSGAH